MAVGRPSRCSATATWTLGGRCLPAALVLDVSCDRCCQPRRTAAGLLFRTCRSLPAFTAQSLLMVAAVALLL